MSRTHIYADNVTNVKFPTCSTTMLPTYVKFSHVLTTVSPICHNGLMLICGCFCPAGNHIYLILLHENKKCLLSNAMYMALRSGYFPFRQNVPVKSSRSIGKAAHPPTPFFFSHQT